ncbi:uncharacterized protein LOC117651149 [Thrips palmi]|uniref:Uncharacterized protein LOC117651149 n=1 Tax=Thrips palmi TaxID=161013 RepID=A0A6P8ZZI3_THRPL|nr:uncharacterized protein LOC117651149 [Thrips palmi]
MDGRAGGWPAFWAWLFTLQWRIVLTLLRVTGHFCAVGWPPRSTRFWTRFCVAICIVATSLKISSILLYAANQIGASNVSYLGWLTGIHTISRGLVTIVLQVMLIWSRTEQAAVVQCLIAYKSCWVPSLCLSRGMALVLAGFLVTSMLHPVTDFVLTCLWVPTQMMTIAYYMIDLLPVFHTMLAGCSIAAVHIACVFLGLDVAADVQGQIHTLARRLGTDMSPEEDMKIALQFRVVRMRQQILQDVVLVSNQAHGGACLCCMFVIVMEASVSSFVGITYLRTQGIVPILWGFCLLGKFVSSFILGQQLCKIHLRIADMVQWFLVRNSSIPNRTRREVQGFRHQVEMQDCRCGAYDLLYFDFPTMKAVRLAACSIDGAALGGRIYHISVPKNVHGER